MGISLQSVFDTLQTYLGSAYANDFNQFGRTYQVRLQGESSARGTPDDILRLRLRDAEGRVVPLAALATVEERTGPSIIVRHNLYPASSIKGSNAAGFSSGQANRRSGIAAIAALGGASGVVCPPLLPVAALSQGVWLVASAPFLRFVARREGLRFALYAAAVHYALSTVVGAAAVSAPLGRGSRR